MYPATSLAKARKAVKPVDPSVYQAFLLNRQGVGPVGGERYEGVDGLISDDQHQRRQVENLPDPLRTLVVDHRFFSSPRWRSSIC